MGLAKFFIYFLFAFRKWLHNLPEFIHIFLLMYLTNYSFFIVLHLI
jgi:hypothetical protein